MNETERINKLADLAILAGRRARRLTNIRNLTARHPVSVPTEELIAALDGHERSES